MDIRENIRQAIRSIRGNFLRSVLTLLIIAFGIMALVGILTSIDSINSAMAENFTSMGANTFNVIRKGTGISSGGRNRRRDRGPVITYDQAKDFKAAYDFGAKVSVHLMCSSMGTAKFGEETTNPNTTIYGADDNYFEAAGYDLNYGRNFTFNEVENGRNVAVIGSEIAEKLKINNKHVEEGVVIGVGSSKYRLIGIMKEKGSSGSFSGDRTVFIPLLNAKRFYATQNSNYNISVIIQNPVEMDAAVDAAVGSFRQARRLRVEEANDFEISKSDSLVKLLEENTKYIRWATIIIGIITLLGAAIGLMNIMLVSVTELSLIHI